ncbi:MAG: hypothetical protein JSS27_04970 [Planctomycetes bacterium]|nr:hypothetical protein [Planctomycetota bacterium]
MDRQAKYLWMQDLLEHLTLCHEQWLLADRRNESYLIDSMRRDVEEMRRLCESLDRAPPLERAGHPLAA